MSTHVDEFIDERHGEHLYARWVLNHMRLPASLKLDFGQFMKDHKLYADYNGRKILIVSASRLGDVGIKFHPLKHPRQHGGYDERIDIDECTNFRGEP